MDKATRLRTPVISSPVHFHVSDSSTPVGVILHEQGQDSEALLARFALSLAAQGADVRGLVQRTSKEDNGKSRMELIDVRSGRSTLISQNLGSGSASCCVDPSGLAEAAVVLQAEMRHRPALLVINKFSGMEAGGTGLVAELFEAVTQGIPVLTTLSRRYQPQWEELTGGIGTMLPPDPAALWAWWSSIPKTSPSSAREGMKIFGLAGWSGAGKTTLIERLISDISGRGLLVSTVKHTHHKFDVDQPGKDSYRHRVAGATEVMVASSLRWALMHELHGAEEPSVEELMAHMTPVDLLIIEGFKYHGHPKIEVHRPSVGKAMLWPSDPHIVAIASDSPLTDLPIPVLDLNDGKVVAEFILERTGLLTR